MAKQQRVNFDTEEAKFTHKQLVATQQLGAERYKYLLYGGAAGGGKSYWLRWYCLRRLIQIYNKYGLKNVVAMLACEDYPALLDRQLQKIGIEWSENYGKMYEDHKLYRRCYILNKEFGSGVIAFRNLDDPTKYHSAEYALIAVDELTMNKYEVFNELRFRLRWPGLQDHQCQFVAGTNPGNIGHSWCKQLWIDHLWPDELKKHKKQFCYVISKATDNPHIDESYWDMLNSLPEHMRKAYRDGDWNIFTGQAFTEFNPVSHVISRHDIPKNAPLYMTFDWGFGAPFSVMWWYVDNDGRVIGCGEWYGWNGTPNTGIRITDSEVAAGIRVREEQMGIWGQNIIRLAGPDCFQKRPDYRGGGQGPSTAEVFAAGGIYIAPGDPSRKLKIRQFRERLMRKIGDRPMLQVFDSCEHFIRTIPAIVTNKNNIEDIDCFVAGTKIKIPYGELPVEKLHIGDLVETPIGYRSILKSGKAGLSKTITIHLSNGKILEATPDHKLYVENRGLVPLCKINIGDVLSTREETTLWNIKNLEESYLQNVTTEDILNVIQVMLIHSEQHFSIEQFGFQKTGELREDFLSIIRTETLLTIVLKTWNLFLRHYMQDTTMKEELKTVAISEEVLKDGEQVTGGKKFYEIILKSAVQMCPLENLRALIVANLLQRDIQQKNIVQTNARNNFTETEEQKKSVPYVESNFLQNQIQSKKLKPVVINAVGNLEEKIVYYLTVEQAHLFYANGVLSSNTTGDDHCFDSCCHICMARPLAAKDDPERLSETDYRIHTLEKPFQGDGFSRFAQENMNAEGLNLERDLWSYETGDDDSPEMHFDLVPF